MDSEEDSSSSKSDEKSPKIKNMVRLEMTEEDYRQLQKLWT